MSIWYRVQPCPGETLGFSGRMNLRWPFPLAIRCTSWREPTTTARSIILKARGRCPAPPPSQPGTPGWVCINPSTAGLPGPAPCFQVFHKTHPRMEKIRLSRSSQQRQIPRCAPARTGCSISAASHLTDRARVWVPFSWPAILTTIIPRVRIQLGCGILLQFTRDSNRDSWKSREVFVGISTLCRVTCTQFPAGTSSTGPGKLAAQPG